jgi:hypothetical protein
MSSRPAGTAFSGGPEGQVPAPPPHEPLLLQQCGQCGYSLTGLPDRGICPECGHPFGPDEIVIFGWDAMQGEEAIRSPRRELAKSWSGGWSDWLFLAGNVIWIILMRPGWVGATAIIGSTAALFFVIWWQQHRLTKAYGAPSQLRLNARGCGRRRGVGDVSIRRWSRRVIWSLKADEPGLYQLTIRRRARPWWITPPWFWAAIIFIFRCSEAEADTLVATLEGLLASTGAVEGLRD